MSPSFASRLHRLEQASIAYLVPAFFVVAAVLAMEWARAVAAMGDGLVAPRDASALEIGSVP